MIRAVGQTSCETGLAIQKGSGLLGRKQDKVTGEYVGKEKKILGERSGTYQHHYKLAKSHNFITRLQEYQKSYYSFFFILPRLVIGRTDAKSQPLQGSHYG